MRNRTDGYYSPTLLCHVIRLEYDYRTGEGRIWFPLAECCDQRGCVALFKGIDPEVKAIQTYSGEEPDTRYDLGRDGVTWDACVMDPGLPPPGGSWAPAAED